MGGRFTQGYLEQVPVRADKGSAAEVPLVQVAGVAFRGGRRWSILCHEERLKTAVKSAFLRSPHFNQQPQDSPDNETELLVMVEPERPEELEKRTKETCHVWREAIRQVQTRRDKVHKQWRANRIIVADDQKVLVKMMQQKQDAQMAIVKKKEQEALAAIQKMAHI